MDLASPLAILPYFLFPLHPKKLKFLTATATATATATTTTITTLCVAAKNSFLVSANLYHLIYMVLIVKKNPFLDSANFSRI
jgi:hypothetical protein